MEKKRKPGRPKKNIKDKVLEYVNDKGDNEINLDDLIPTGLTMLDLALSDHWQGGFKKGTIVNPIGDSDAGKSLVALTGLACCANNERFDDYELKYICSESKTNFKFDLFGEKFNKRVEIVNLEYPPLLENVIAKIEKWIDKDKPHIFVVDSLDGLKVNEDMTRLKDLIKKGEQSGSYKTERAKLIKDFLGSIKQRLQETGSNLQIISQTIDNINSLSSLPIRAGGKALKFFSTHEFFWSIIGAHRKREIEIGKKKIKRPIGTTSSLRVTKNHLTGKHGVYEKILPIYYTYGIHNIVSLCEFMRGYGFWEKSKEDGCKDKYVIPEFERLDYFGGPENKQEGVVEFIQNNNLEAELVKIVGQKWIELQKLLKVEGNPRFK